MLVFCHQSIYDNLVLFTLVFSLSFSVTPAYVGSVFDADGVDAE